MSRKLIVGITQGDGNGIGYEVIIKALADERGQSLAQMALAWVLKDDLVTSVIVGASSTSQLMDNLKAADNTRFSAEELEIINQLTIA